MREEVEWYRKPPEINDGDMSRFIFRAIRWHAKEGRYTLISTRQNPDVSGRIDITEIIFEDPKELTSAIVSLGAGKLVSICAKGSLSRAHREFERIGGKLVWHDHATLDDTIDGTIALMLRLENGTLAAFEPVVQAE
jgi:hypothetical protein